MTTISTVVPLYREEENAPRMVQALVEMAKSLPKYDFEFILVDDGSPDQTAEVARALCASEPRLMVIELSRNFGKEVALSCGVHQARGDAVICLDGDLQHPPSLIPDMVRAWEGGAQVVEMVRNRTEREALVRKLGSRLFYFILDKISEVEIMSQSTDFRLLDRVVVDAFKTVGERKRLFRGIIDWLGFRKVRLHFDAPMRDCGEAGYSYAKLVNLALDSFISYSSIPLKLIGITGGLITVASFLLLMWMLFSHHLDARFYYTPLAQVVVFNTLLIGTVLLALGMTSLYISKIYTEVQGRPLFAVRQITRGRAP